MTEVRLLAGSVRTGRASYDRVDVFGETDAELGVPLVELAGRVEQLRHLTIGQALQLSAALELAARHARGEHVPTALEEFIAKRSGGGS